MPTITRKTDKGLPRYRDEVDSDEFILSGAEDLVRVLVEANGDWVREELPVRSVDGTRYRIERYRPRIEGLFARIERWTNEADPADCFWRSISGDNITTWYGRSSSSRIADPADPSRIFSWLICESHDDKGNVMVYDYQQEDSANVGLARAHEANRNDLSRSANRYLKRIRYGNRRPYSPVLQDGQPPTPLPSDWLFEVVLDYGDHDELAPTPRPDGSWGCRNDPFSSYRAGFEVRTYRLCQRVLMFHHFADEPGVGADCLVRSTDFHYRYEEDPGDARNPVHSVLISATQSGYRRQSEESYLKRSLPPVEFRYSEARIDEAVHDVDPASLQHLPDGLSNDRYRWTDLDGEGLSGVLIDQGEAWYYKRNLSPINGGSGDGGETVVAQFGALERIAGKPSSGAMASGGHQLLDLAGDGQLDLVSFEAGSAGFFERSHDQGWVTFRPFRSLPNLDWRNPNLRFLDLTGDGRADLLISEEDAFCWHASLGEEGFGPAQRVPQAMDEEEGPRLVLEDGTQSMHLADLSGDGLTDLVRIRNGEVCYWPSLGYGRFGAKVTMDKAPWFDGPDLFDQRRIRLADIDGSGVTDIIYLGDDGVDLYFNQSGNSWSAPHSLAAFPTIDDLSSVQVLDLLGNGTACLVWSSPLPGDSWRPMRYVDLIGGQKPHLLVGSENNLGAETRIHYASSTKFFVDDQLAGRPWITRLPFPVHVVERVETFDHISRNRFVTRYAYHHGYFDGVEREFRGFGMVEQWDTEAYAALRESQDLPIGDNIDESSHVPPVLTKTWFHTGASIGRHHVSDFFAGLLDADDIGEYYREPGLDDDQAKALLLEDTILPESLTAEEEREACRALKGAMLRQEVYAQDGTAKEPHPYTVTEQNFTIRLLQPKADNPHGVFLTHAREAINYHYERQHESDAVDPRVAHALTLDVDDYGNVRKSAAVGYGRRHADMNLSVEDRATQAQTLITYTESRVTNAVDAIDSYRTPLPCETRTYELTGIEPGAGAAHFSFDEWTRNALALPASAVEISYERQADGTSAQKRLIEQVRTLYRKDDLTAYMPLGELEPLALPGESYQLAFTPGLLADAYGDRVTAEMLASEGRYVHSEGDANWWIPSGRVFFSPGSDDPPAAELAYAREHFFLPQRFRDPFHDSELETESFVVYDTYDLLVQETRDALANRMTVGERNHDPTLPLVRHGHDYRVLQAAQVMDPNRNRAAVVFDTLGMVVGTAVMGKPGEILGDSLDGFNADPTELVILDHLADPLADPHAILGRATTRLAYDIFAYQRSKEDPQPAPTVVYTLARETHAPQPEAGEHSRVQHNFNYSDGLGREIQKKTQAEPGPLNLGGAEISPRWVGSGWTVFNNKGKPVRQFEPFFSRTHRFELDVQVGVSPIVFYDPAQRPLATLHPNHTWQKVVFDSWSQESWDVNDTVLVADPAADDDVGQYLGRLAEDEYSPTWHAGRIDGDMGTHAQAAALKTEAHAATPTVTYLDSLGRTFLTVTDNGVAADGHARRQPTRATFDIEGNQLAVTDPLGREVMGYEHDMVGSPVHFRSMDSGDRWTLNAVDGQPVRTWDSRGHSFRYTYDSLRRAKHRYVVGADHARSDPRTLNGEVLFERIDYGENEVDPESLNLRGRVIRTYDGAGISVNSNYDFKGNLLVGHRQLATDYKAIPDWSKNPELDSELFGTRSQFDALNRPVRMTSPDGTEVCPSFNDAGLLERIDARLSGATDRTVFVDSIAYDAKGQRRRIVYGNGVETSYEYDPLTFLLTRLRSSRDSDGDLQDLSYTYDPTGNIIHIHDDAQQTIFFDNSVVEPHNDYRYDALYQLVDASGREHRGQTGPTDHHELAMPSHPSDGQVMRVYRQSYEYDAVGNILNMIHRAPGNNWTRHYGYAADSNRLLATSLPGDKPDGPYSATYGYDDHGSMTTMPHLPSMVWNFLGQLQQSAAQVVDEGTPETTHYVYDSTGQRVRKVTDGSTDRDGTPTRTKERVYLTSSLETFREYGDQGTDIELERETFQLFDDSDLVAVVDTLVAGDDESVSDLVRYQLSSHLGSTRVELDSTGHIFSYEEYHPYGSTSYRAADPAVPATAKRYRFTGLETDEESGLSLHGVRYYARWLARWTSADRNGVEDGLNRWSYARRNPVNGIDRTGTSTKEATRQTKARVARNTTQATADKAKEGADLKSDLKRHSRRIAREAQKSALRQGLRTIGSGVASAAEAVLPVAAVAGVTAATAWLVRSSEAARLAVATHSWVRLSQSGVPTDFHDMYMERVELGHTEAWMSDWVEGILHEASPHEREVTVLRYRQQISGAGEGQPITLDSTGLPIQLGDSSGPRIGPAYATHEDAIAARNAIEARTGNAPHVAHVILEKYGMSLASWWEVSQTGLGIGRNQPFGDTEQKAIARLNPNMTYDGYRLLISGTIAPCDGTRGLGCLAVMEDTVEELGLEIDYMWIATGATNHSRYTFLPQNGHVRGSFVSTSGYTAQ